MQKHKLSQTELSVSRSQAVKWELRISLISFSITFTHIAWMPASHQWKGRVKESLNYQRKDRRPLSLGIKTFILPLWYLNLSKKDWGMQLPHWGAPAISRGQSDGETSPKSFFLKEFSPTNLMICDHLNSHLVCVIKERSVVNVRKLSVS